MLDLASALRQRSSAAPITQLNVGALPDAKLIAVLLDSSPSLRSLHVDIQAAVRGPPGSLVPPKTPEPQLPGTQLHRSFWTFIFRFAEASRPLV